MYKGTFEIKAGLNRNTYVIKRGYQSNKSEKRGKEGTKTQASDWATDSGADIFNREVFNFKETELITKKCHQLAGTKNNNLHTCFKSSYPRFKTGKRERRKKNSVFTFHPCNAIFLCSGHAIVLGSSAKMFPMHYNAIKLGLEQRTTYMV